MELIWLVLALLAVDLAAIFFAVDTRPGFEHSPRPWVRPGTRGDVRPVAGPRSSWARRSAGG
ncbi:MAG TPA: hypothetical protein VJ966_06130 [Actinomycetes bacterium]|nr:hypothetical protein [Actinomycetes bacterium]